MNKLHNKVVLITGGTKGIGAATVEVTCQAGAQVIFTARGEEAGRIFEQELREKGFNAAFKPQDVASDANWKDIVESITAEYGALHGLVNNAAVGEQKLFKDHTAEDYDWMFDINVRGVFFGIQAALPLMRVSATAQNPASIINVSTASVTNAASEESCYNATKGAVQTLSHCLAKEFGELKYNIRVNTVNPGFVWTDMAAMAMQAHVDKGEFASLEEARQYWIDRYYPIGRLGEPEDVAKLITFLLSDDASYITGAKLAVDGGETA